MREEEYLAYDVYVTLNNKWGVNIFKNISESEYDVTYKKISTQKTSPKWDDQEIFLQVFEKLSTIQQIHYQLLN